MSITIKMRNSTNWRLGITEETWEFKTRKDMESVLKQLLDIKVKYGNLKKNG